MSRRRRPRPANKQPDVRAIIREELAKALSLPPGAKATPISQEYLAALSRQGMSSGNAKPLPRDPLQSKVGFGPGSPLIPSPLDPALLSGQPAPRRYDYPGSWNLQVNNRPVPFSVLRDAADRVSIMRRCIEVRKSAIAGLEWSFTIDPTRVSRLAQVSGVSRHEITSELAHQHAELITRLQEWWAIPDRINGWTFTEWVTALLEEQLVLDAVALYPHLTLGGDLHSLELIDGATIKPLLDYRGATPQPPQPAYQQILHGFPRGEFTASPSDEVDAEFVSAVYGRADGQVSTDCLIYKVRTRRTNSPYGFSNVEQALLDATLWLRRIEWLGSEYSAGVVPEMIVGVDTPFTPEQLAQYEQVFNDALSGRAAERHRAKFLPAGFTPIFPPGMDEKFSPELDLHLIRLICADFDVLPSSLGFVPTSGLGGKGHQEGEADSEHRRGTKPTAEWITDLVNEISRKWLGMPPEVTFRFEGLDNEDEEKTARVLSSYVSAGMKTVNEARDELSLPRYDLPEADQPHVTTGYGPTLLGSAVQSEPPAQPQQQVNDEEDTTAAPNNTDAERRTREQRKFLLFAEKRLRGGQWWDYNFQAHPPEVGEAANRLAAAGDIAAVEALFKIVG